jgi:hypothetical protein
MAEKGHVRETMAANRANQVVFEWLQKRKTIVEADL